MIKVTSFQGMPISVSHTNDCPSGLEILVTGCSALERRKERIMRIDRSTVFQIIELMTSANKNNLRDPIIYISDVVSPNYLSTSPNTRSMVPMIATTSGK
jgi:hypothetical protein